MEDYKGFKIGKDGRGKWFYIFPSGFKAYPPGVNAADEIKAIINNVLAE